MDRPEAETPQRAAQTTPWLARIPAFLTSTSLALPLDAPPSQTQRRRAIRVWLLVLTIIVLSVADLYMTLAHLRSAGMGEANPLARMVISYQSPLLLSLWKSACVALASLILILARFRRSGELACWVSCLVLTALTIHWIHYSVEAATYTRQINEQAGTDIPGNWVSMEGG